MGPLRRIVVGFLFEAASMAYAIGVQHRIYISPPCYWRPRACPASMNGSLPNDVNIAVQVPVYILDGISEAFASPAGYDYAFTLAPRGMKSIIQALFSLTAAGGSLIALALAPIAKDPTLLYLYVGLGSAMFIASLVVVVLSWKYEHLTVKK
ncbi:hypothetical protein F4823DRAFT_607924 [Ustulina deusta]|nr:hypothetical protein F4823DRAFT_607924 [Ustulina deusta]